MLESLVGWIREKRNLVIFSLLLVISIAIFIRLDFIQNNFQPIQPTQTPTMKSRWEPLSSLPYPNAGLATCVDKSTIFIFSGEDELGNMTGETILFDVDTKTWDSRDNKPTPVADYHAEWLGGLIYLPGGRAQDGLPTTTVEIFDPVLKVWVNGVPLPEPRSAYALISFEGKLFLFGGWDGKIVKDTVYIFDPGQNIWTIGVPMTTPRSFLSAAVQNGNIILIGGQDNLGTPLDVVEIFSPKQDEGVWNLGPNLPFPRTAADAVTLADNIYLIGGRAIEENSEPSPLSSLILTRNLQWGILDVNFQRRQYRSSLVVIGPMITALGGMKSDQATNDIDQLQVLFSTAIPLIIR